MEVGNEGGRSVIDFRHGFLCLCQPQSHTPVDVAALCITAVSGTCLPKATLDMPSPFSKSYSYDTIFAFKFLGGNGSACY